MRSAIMPSLSPLINSPNKIKVEFFSRELRELPAILLSDEVDFIVFDKALDDGSIQSELLGEETLVHIRNKTIEQRAETPVFLDHDVHDMTTFDFFSKQGKANLAIDRCFYDGIYRLLDGVRMGFGDAIASKHMINEDDISEVLPHEVDVKSSVYLLYIKNIYLAGLQKQVIEHWEKNVPKCLVAAC